MAFFDWTGDGEIDMFDDFIEYRVFTECTKDDDEEENDDFLDEI